MSRPITIAAGLGGDIPLGKLAPIILTFRLIVGQSIS
jgi:hypothetical protein